MTETAMLASEGISLSQALGRSMAANEIEAESKSTALLRQETPWSTFACDIDF